MEPTCVEMVSGLEELVGDAPVPGGAWQEEGMCYFGSCKALTFLSQERTKKASHSACVF